MFSPTSFLCWIKIKHINPPSNSPTDCGGTLSNIFIDSSEDDDPYHILFSFIPFLSFFFILRCICQDARSAEDNEAMIAVSG